MAADPALRKLFMISPEGEFSVLEADSGEIIDLGMQAPASYGSAAPFVINPNNHYVYVLSNSPNYITVFNGHSYDYVTTLTLLESSAIAVDPTTNLLYIAYADGIAVLNGTTHQVIDTITDTALSSGGVNELAIDTCLGRLYAPSLAAGAIVVIDLDTRQIINEIPSGPVTRVKTDQRQRQLWAVGSDNVITIYDSCSLEQIDLLPPYNTRGLAVDQMNSLVYTASYTNESVPIFDSLSNTVFRMTSSGILFDQVAVMSCTPPCGRHTCQDSGFTLPSARPAYAFTQDVYAGLVYRINPSTLQVDRTINLGGMLEHLAADPELRQLYVANIADGLLEIIDADSTSTLQTISIPGLGSVTVNPLNHKLYATGNFGIIEIDGLRREISGNVPIDASSVYELTVNPIDNTLYYIYRIAGINYVRQWSYLSNQIINEWPIQAGQSVNNLLVNGCNGAAYALRYTGSNQYDWLKFNKDGSTTVMDFIVSNAPATFTAIDGARNLLYSIDGANLVVYDLCACEVLRSMALPDVLRPRDVSLDNVNQLLYITQTNASRVYVYDAVTLQQRNIISESSTPFGTVTMSPRSCAPCNCGCCEDTTLLAATGTAAPVAPPSRVVARQLPTR